MIQLKDKELMELSAMHDNGPVRNTEIISNDLSPLDNCTVELDDNQEKKPLTQQAAGRIRIDFKDLKYSVRPSRRAKQKREILRGVSGYFRGGCLNAIIGPSGAGKSTLMNVICGSKTHIDGSICVNGVHTVPNVLRKIVCYIPQEFVLLPGLTTKETLYFAARLKIFKKNSSIKSFSDIINETAEKLGLVNCLETMADALSGGEKKRLSIGVEIVVKPMILILDEPTSGLDSAASNQVITLLKNMSDSGCTIACSIHQPSSHMMTMFDDILLLAEGRSIYCGPADTIVETFGQAGFICPSFYNIGEFVIEVATGQRTGDFDHLKKLNNQNQLPYNDKSNGLISNQLEPKMDIKYYERQSAGWFNEFRVLIWRALLIIRRDNTMTKLRLVAHVIVGLLLGFVFRNFGDEASKILSNVACLFFFILFLFFSNSMPAVQMFPVEAAVFSREYLNNWYKLWTYYLAKVITDLPLQIICPTLFLAIGWCLTGQPLEIDRFLQAWVVCFLLSIIAQSFGILAGAIFNTHIGCFLVPALSIPLLLFAGFFLKYEEIATYLQPVRAISFFRYAFEGMLQAVYGGDRPKLKCSTEFCLFRWPKSILTHMDMPSTTFTTIILVLTGWMLILHILTYIVLRCKLINVIK